MCVMSVSGSNASRAASLSRRSTGRNSTFRPLGSSGFRRPTPITSQPAERNFSVAATPSRPLAPATNTFFFVVLVLFIVFNSSNFGDHSCYLDLGDAAIDEEFDARDITRFV